MLKKHKQVIKGRLDIKKKENYMLASLPKQKLSR